MLALRADEVPESSHRSPRQPAAYSEPAEAARPTGRVAARALTDAAIQAMRDGETRTDGSLPVGSGRLLIECVKVRGVLQRRWIFRQRSDEGVRKLRLGDYPAIGLDEVRSRVRGHIEQVRKGVDPRLAAFEQRQAVVKAVTAPGFEEASWLESDQLGLSLKCGVWLLGLPSFQPPAGAAGGPRLGHVLMVQPSCSVAMRTGLAATAMPLLEPVVCLCLAEAGRPRGLPLARPSAYLGELARTERHAAVRPAGVGRLGVG
jgi:hypothetical protein